jgi:hypothetical protein
MLGIERIAAERQRQIEKEGWTPAHDDQHRNDELVRLEADMDTCTWSEDADSVWTSDCGQDFELVWGTPTENEFTYCCFCGKKLVEKQYSEENEE